MKNKNDVSSINDCVRKEGGVLRFVLFRLPANIAIQHAALLGSTAAQYHRTHTKSQLSKAK